MNQQLASFGVELGESGHFDTGQSNASVKNLDALLGSNCVVF